MTETGNDRSKPFCFTLSQCRLGRLLLAGTECGIRAVYLGDSDAQLEAELRSDYPSAGLRRANVGMDSWLSALVNHLDGRQPCLDLPLDVWGTTFQWRVWQELRAIPYGNTRSYRHIACSLGLPNAVRAVGRACASNPVSLVIPCHRVVRADGGLGGYRWGLERKQALLAQERRTMPELV